ncbi:hypothetical protein MPLSOD_280048 [Mesorhizobium sp. SOD10]|nr:hypothetical protein MPLSOD_280048 [Mesorhizobium sp. SOD10]
MTKKAAISYAKTNIGFQKASGRRQRNLCEAKPFFLAPREAPDGKSRKTGDRIAWRSGVPKSRQNRRIDP